jgi:hypothetical protein
MDLRLLYGDTNSAVEALECQNMIIMEPCKILAHWNLIKSSKILVTRTNEEKSIKYFVTTEI